MEAVSITARVEDPDGVREVVLKYRIDPSSTTSSVEMRDDGTGEDAIANDGLYSAWIPGQPNNALVAFSIEAEDDSDQDAESRFPGPSPEETPDLECLIRFGETYSPGAFGTYKIWVTSENVADWIARPTRSNEPVDCTFVYNDQRVIYNANVRYRGNWRISYPDYQHAAYVVNMPKCERLLGDTEVALDLISRHDSKNNGTLQQERHAYWMARQIGLAAAFTRYTHVHVNGASLFMHDLFSPSRSMCRSWYGDDDPHVYEQLAPLKPFNSYTTTGDVPKQARYRYGMRKKRTTVPDDDYSALYRIITALRAPTDALYVSRVLALADIRSWAGYWLINRMAGNEDHYRSEDYPHNLYTYIPPYERSRLHVNDTDMAFFETYSLFPPTSYLPGVMFSKPEFRRIYWRLARDLVHGPIAAGRSDEILDAWHQAFQDEGIDASDPASMASWIAGRRTYMAGLLEPVTGVVFRVMSPDSPTSASTAVLEGKAPIQVSLIHINGREHTVTWSGETTWEARVPLTNGINELHCVGYDEDGALVGSDLVDIACTGENVSPEDHLVINEIMYHPAAPRSGFVEIHNTSGADSFHLGGLRLNGADVTISNGQFIEPGGYAVVAGSLPGYQSSYGNVEVVVGEYAGTLDHGGETLSLLMPSGSNQWVVLDEVTYDDDAPWPVSADGTGPSLQLIDSDVDNNRIGNWTASAATPGADNQIAADLPALPRLWISEIMHSNVSTMADNAGEFEPWIELYNAESTRIDLGEAFYLSTSPADPLMWRFPEGVTIGPAERIVIWADGEEAETEPGDTHTAFRLNSTTGIVVLTRLDPAATTIIDALNYGDVGPDVSTGRYPDDDPFSEQVFYSPTPGALNSTAVNPVRVRINEWMADNKETMGDPADGDFEDWFELHNDGDGSANLGGYWLTDDLADMNSFRIPGGTMLVSGGHMLIWADDETDQNDSGGALHVNFKLGKTGDSIGLYGPGGQLIDAVTFGPQEQDVSLGLWPDGEGGTTLMSAATPGETNRALAVIGADGMGTNGFVMMWLSESGKAYHVEWCDALPCGQWQPLGVVTAHGPIMLQSDTIPSVTSARFYRVTEPK